MPKTITPLNKVITKVGLNALQKGILGSTSDITLALCGRGSGKTKGLGHFIAKDLIKGRSTIAVAPTFLSLSQDLMSETLSCLRLYGCVSSKEAKETKAYQKSACSKLIFDYNKSDHIITFRENGCRVLGISNQNFEVARGKTEYSNLVMDEAARCDKDALITSMACLRGEKTNGIHNDPRMFLATTPVAGANWVSILAQTGKIDKEGDLSFKLLSGSCYGNPFISDKYRKMLLGLYAAGNDAYARMEVYGEIMDIDGNADMFPSALFKGRPTPDDENGPFAIGIDFAGSGGDRTTVILRNREKIVYCEGFKQDVDGLFIAKKVRSLEQKYGKTNILFIAYDATGGWHRDFESVMRPSNDNLVPVNFGGGAPVYDDSPSSPHNIFENNRAFFYSNLRSAIDAGFFAGNSLEAEEDTPEWFIVQELRAVSYFINSRGRRQLIKKELIKRMLGGLSPDFADALAVSFYKDLDAEFIDYTVRNEDKVSSFDTYVYSRS